MTDSKAPVKVLVIGTEPPCPRCALLCRMVEQAAADGTPVEIDHCAFEDEKAGKLAERHGRRVGTAKHVSQASGIELDWCGTRNDRQCEESRRPRLGYRRRLDSPAGRAARSLHACGGFRRLLHDTGAGRGWRGSSPRQRAFEGAVARTSAPWALTSGRLAHNWCSSMGHNRLVWSDWGLLFAPDEDVG